jgi:electron transfer flavoprotein alpha subunit
VNREPAVADGRAGHAMAAVIPVRAGVLPAGADEVVAECGRGTVIVVGDGASLAAPALHARWIGVIEGPVDDPAAAAEALAAHLDPFGTVVLPAGPEGRDLAPVVARSLGRPLLAGAIEVTPGGALVSRCSGMVTETLRCDLPFVATLVPGVRGMEHVQPTEAATIVALGSFGASPGPLSTTAVLPPDPATMDLGEASVIVAGGSGLGSKERFDQLAAIGRSLGASLGGTRVASDAGWIPFERQIGTTGVTVAPRTYLAFAISGATQHTSGLGDPERIISVNLDPSCPMMSMADLAIVADANAVLDELHRRLVASTATPGRGPSDMAQCDEEER